MSDLHANPNNDNQNEMDDKSATGVAQFRNGVYE